MDRRVVRPLRRSGGGWLLPVAAVALSIAALGALMISAMVGTGTGFGFELFVMLGMVAAVLLLIPTAVWFAATSEWHFTNTGFTPHSGPLRFAAREIRWDGVAAVGLSRAAVRVNGSKGLALTVMTERSGVPAAVTLSIAAADPDVIRTVLGEMLDHVAAERIDPALVVVEDMLRIADGFGDRTLPGVQPALEATRGFRLESAASKLDAAARSLEPSDPRRPALALLSGQAHFVMGRAKKALEACEAAFAPAGEQREAALCAGLAAAELGELQRAGVLLSRAACGPREAVISAARRSLETPETRPMRVRGPAVALLCAVMLLLFAVVALPIVGLLGGPELGRVARYVPFVLSGIVAVMLVAILGWEISKRSRHAAAEEPEPARPLAALSEPERRELGVRRFARGLAWFAFGTFLIAFAVLAVAQLAGVFAPQLLARVGGEAFAQRTFVQASLYAILVSVVALVWAVRLGALRRVVPSSVGVVTQAPSEDVSATPMLNAAIGKPWLFAAVAAVVVFAAAAAGIAVWSPPVLGFMTTDRDGNIITLLGDSVIRWDADGGMLGEFALEDVPGGVGVPSDMCVGADGTVYVADAERRQVWVFDPGGTFMAGVETGIPPLLGSGLDFSLTLTPCAEGALALDSSKLVVVTPEGRRLAREEYPDLRWATGVAADERGWTYVCDTVNGRVLRLSPGEKTEVVDCLGFADGYRYPERVRLAPDGSVYALLRKPWGYREMGLPGRPLSAHEAPDVWMGKLYRLDFESGHGRLLDVSHEGRLLNVNDIAFMPSGVMIVLPLNEEALYALGNPEDPASALKLNAGTMGGRLAKADFAVRVDSAGPQVLLGLAIVVPMGIGVAGVVASRRKPRGSNASHPMRARVG